MMENEIQILQEGIDDGNALATAAQFNTLQGLIGAAGEGSNRNRGLSGTLVPLSLKALDVFYTSDTVCEAAGSFLQKLVTGLSPDVVIEDLSTQIEAGLSHAQVAVRALSARQVKRAVASNVKVSEELLSKSCALIRDEHVRVAKVIEDLCSELARTPDGRSFLLENKTSSVFDEAAATSSTIQIRVQSLFVSLASQSEELFRAVKESHLLDITATLKSEDTLMQLNSLQLLTELSRSPHGYKFLLEQGVITKLQQLLDAKGKDPMWSLVAPAIYAFFEEAYKENDMSDNDYKWLYDNLLRDSSDASDITLQAAVLNACGGIGATHAGLIHILETDGLVEAIVAGLFRTNDIKMHVVILQAVTKMLDNPSELSGNENERNRYCKKTYELISSKGDLLDWIKRSLREPFKDKHMACFGILQSLCTHPWGRKTVVSTPGVLEFLLDRKNAVASYDSSTWKFGIVQRLAADKETLSLIDGPMQLKLRTYVREGVFAPGRDAAVMVDTQNS